MLIINESPAGLSFFVQKHNNIDIRCKICYNRVIVNALCNNNQNSNDIINQLWQEKEKDKQEGNRPK